ncbi:MAG: hypothetical protein OER80_07180 [Gammaproteobacteria bacterium]|nr:hypothetical protein [Gammaproteobacteria bacterium]MDH3766880.1 hypothetical protein [Gammaproteobacteria bacterium]
MFDRNKPQHPSAPPLADVAAGEQVFADEAMAHADDLIESCVEPSKH